MSADGPKGYVFRSADEKERDRLNAHGRLWDAFTFRRLADTGIGPGWQCLEIGAGTGSVASWIVGRVGPTGRVVATDIETRWLEPMAAANLEVRHHDVADDPLEDGGYDLIHARLVLEHLPQRATVLTKLVAALRPGGHLVVEDYDVRTMQLTEARRDEWATVSHAIIDALRSTGTELLCGQHLPRLLREAGLTDVTSEGIVYPMTIPELAPVFRPALEQLAPLLLGTGRISRAQLDHVLAEFDHRHDPAVAYTPILVSASGRCPETTS